MPSQPEVNVVEVNTVEVNTVEVNGYPTTYATAGSGPTVLFLHGEANTSPWREFHDELARHFRVVAPVHPGFAATELPDWLDTVDDLAFHYVDLIRVLSLQRPLVVGESLGGWIALSLGIHRPDLLEGVALVGALGLRADPPMADLFLKEQPDMLAMLSATIPGDRYDAMAGDAELITALWVEQAAQARLMWERPYDPRLARRAHHLSCPAAVYWGNDDRLLPVAHGARLAGLVGAAAPTVVQGSGHLVTVDAPAALAEAIRTWRSSRP